MKASLFFYKVLVVLITLLSSCSDDSGEKVLPAYDNRCFTIVDRGTGLPVEGAHLMLNYNYSNTNIPATAYNGTSDINGLMCGEIRSDARPYYWKVTKENYQMICNTDEVFPPETINMDYKSYLKFEIKNEEPYTEQDRIIISYSDLTCFGINEVRLNGINVDTTLIRVCSPNSPSYINISSTGANPFTDQIQINVSSRDTTVVNIDY